MDVKLPIKIKDKRAIELTRKMSGYRKILDIMAFNYGVVSREFWNRIQKVYKIDLTKQSVLFDSVNDEIKEE